VPSYIDLGARGPVKGVLDTTGRNKNNWTVTFPPELININVLPQFELYKLIVTGGAPGATFNVYRDLDQWDTAVYAVNNSWDPVNALPMRPGQYLYFFYSDLQSDGFQPIITAHFRYDPAIAMNVG
jgi:hypothetical protein